MQSKNNKTKTASTNAKKVDTTQPTQNTTVVVAVENANKIVENKLQDKVVEVKKGGARSKTTQNKETVVQAVAQPVVQAVAQPVVQAVAQPVVQAVAQPVVQAVAQPVVQAAGAKSKKVVKNTEKVEQVVAQQVVAQPVVAQTAGTKGKKVVKNTEKVEHVQVVQPVVEQKVAVVEQKAGGKNKKAKVTVQEVQEVVEQKVQEDEEEQVGGKLRYFKLFYNNQNKGRYCGKKPKQAANKAFSSIIKELGSGSNDGINVDINFSIKECTRNSKHKEYKYVGKREVLPEPVPVYIPHTGVIATESVKQESSVKNIAIRQKKVETLHSGKEVTTNGGSIYLMSESGQTFKKIIYHYHNKIQKAPKAVAEEAAVA